MRKEKMSAEERDDGSYVVKKSRKSNILAFILCVLIAFFIWAYTVTKENKLAEESAEAAQSTAELCADITSDALGVI